MPDERFVPPTMEELETRRRVRDLDDAEVERMRRDVRGRRYLLCRQNKELHKTVKAIEVTPENEPLRREIANLVSMVLRLSIALNDGGCSNFEVQRF